MNLLKDDIGLIFSGFLTWCLVTFFRLQSIDDHTLMVLCTTLFMIFVTLFLLLSFDFYGSIKAFKISNLFTQGVCVLILVTLQCIWKDYSSLTLILLVIWAAQLPTVLSRKQAYLCIVLVNSLLVILFFMFSAHQNTFINLAVQIGFQLFALSSSLSRIAAKEANVALKAMHQKLKMTQDLLAIRSKEQERIRIARDLHDSIGHQLTALSLQLEVAHHKIPADSHLQSTIKQCQDIAKDLLQNVRNIVKEMRNSPKETLTSYITSLNKQLPNVKFELSGEITITNILLLDQIFLCLQEETLSVTF
ncbi:MAG: histidine kinase dimerization/phosphoacceptor domain-containing protein [Pseudomonadota bacterium]